MIRKPCGKLLKYLMETYLHFEGTLTFPKAFHLVDTKDGNEYGSSSHGFRIWRMSDHLELCRPLDNFESNLRIYMRYEVECSFLSLDIDT